MEELYLDLKKKQFGIEFQEYEIYLCFKKKNETFNEFAIRVINDDPILLTGREKDVYNIFVNNVERKKQLNEQIRLTFVQLPQYTPQ